MIKKVLYGSLIGIAGTESFVLATRLYEVIKVGKIFYLGGFIPIAPYWLMYEGAIAIFLPIIIKIFKLINKDGTVADDYELAEAIKKLNNAMEETNGIK